MSSVPPIEPSREAPILVPVTPTSNSSGDQAGKKNIIGHVLVSAPCGGVDVYVRLLKEQLERAGHQVDVLAHHPDMAHYYLVNGGEMVEKWPIKSVIYDKVMRFFQRFLSHVDPWIRYREIERYCFEVAASLFDLKQYDVIHTQDIISTRALSRVKPPSTALVATIHGLLAKEHLISGEIRSKESLAWKYASDEEYYGCISADSTIVPAHWLRRELAQFGVPPQMLTVILRDGYSSVRRPAQAAFYRAGGQEGGVYDQLYSKACSCERAPYTAGRFAQINFGSVLALLAHRRRTIAQRYSTVDYRLRIDGAGNAAWRSDQRTLSPEPIGPYGAAFPSG